MAAPCGWLPLLLLTAAALISLAAVSAQEGCLPGSDPEDSCRASTSTSTLCSGRGRCICGKCQCSSPAITGDFCECDHRSCDRYLGQLCGGVERGECFCGRCSCHPGWDLDACQCSLSTDTCIEPGTDRVCSNKGSCVCGQCHCYEHDGESYAGHYCEICPTCKGKCDTYRHCVECLAFDTGPLKNRCQEACGQVNFELVEERTASGVNDRLCTFYTPEGCRFEFTYGRGGSLRVKRRLDCPLAAPGLSTPPSGPEGNGCRAANSAVTMSLCVALLTAICWW